MKQINNWNDILKWLSVFKSNEYFVNNFYPNETEMTIWIENGEFFIENIGDEAYFFVHKTRVALYLFFFIKDFSNLKTALFSIQKQFEGNIIAFDYICRDDEERFFIKDTCLSSGFFLNATLRRMSLVLQNNLYQDIPDISFAKNSDINSLYEMFNVGFDPISERVPEYNQIKKFIEKKSILIYKIKEQIAGFAVVDIQKKSMYLKYLFTNPEFRRQGIAEKLLNKAFFLSKSCIRFILWVIDSNKPAINLYKKFGYDFETLSNYTFVKKNKIDMK